MILNLVDEQLVLYGNEDEIQKVKSHPKFKLSLKRMINNFSKKSIFFKEEIAYSNYKNIIETMNIISDKRKIHLEVSNEIYDYIVKNESYINYKYSIGNDIKKRDERYFDKFLEFNHIVATNMHRRLREQQMWDSFFMTVLEKSGNFSVPGSGKTSSVYGMFAYLKATENIKRVVMIGPKNSFISWKDEFLFCFKNFELNCFDIHDYSNNFSRKKALKFETGNSNLILINYEALGTYLEEIKSLTDEKTLLVFDEVHKIKNPKGIRASFAKELALNAKYLVALTGTPIPNGYQDIYNFLNIIYPKDYNQFFGFTLQTLNKPNEIDMENINNKIHPFFCRTTKDDLKVPKPNEDKIVEFNHDEKENELFKVLYNKYSSNPLSFMIRVLQLESDPQMLLSSIDINDFNNVLDISDSDVISIDYVNYSSDVIEKINAIKKSTKMENLLNVVETLITTNKNAIIWCIFIKSMENIQSNLASKGIQSSIISGETDQDDRNKIIKDFKEGNIQFLITNPHTLAESVSLHKNCHDAIYFEYSYNLVHLLQSKDRIHRLGLNNDAYTQYYYLTGNFEFQMESFSLDAKIYQRLKEKENRMLDSIDNHKLELLPTNDEDIHYLFEQIMKS